MNKRFYLSIVIIVLQIILAVYLNSLIPEDSPIPVHWNIRGEVDAYSTSRFSFLMFPLINLILLLIMIFLPFFSVRYKQAKEQFDKVIPSMTNILVLFFALIHLYTMLIAAGKVDESGNFIYIFLGLMFVLLGRLMPGIPSNFFAGIRTPWTLSSQEVWYRTHKLGGICFIISGVLMIIVPLIWPGNPVAMTILFVSFLLLVLYPALYSFILYKRYSSK